MDGWNIQEQEEDRGNLQTRRVNPDSGGSLTRKGRTPLVLREPSCTPALVRTHNFTGPWSLTLAFISPACGTYLRTRTHAPPHTWLYSYCQHVFSSATPPLYNRASLSCYTLFDMAHTTTKNTLRYARCMFASVANATGGLQLAVAVEFYRASSIQVRRSSDTHWHRFACTFLVLVRLLAC